MYIQNKKPPRYAEIASVILSRIENDELNIGDSLGGENVIAQEFGVHRLTARRALQELAKQGYLKRLPGRGTFVASKSDKNQSIRVNQCVGLFIRAQGHVYSDQAQYLSQALQDNNFLSLLVDLPESRIYTKPLKIKNPQLIADVLESDIAAAIIDGAVLPDVTRLAPNIKNFRNIIVINQIFFPLEDYVPKAYTVLSDWSAGASIAVRHLLDQGHRKIGFFTAGHPPEKPRMPYTFSRRLYMQEFLKGIKSTLQQEGLNPEENLKVVYDESRKDESNQPLRKLLQSSDRPSCFLTSSDAKAKELYHISKELGINIPKDLAIIGYYNTPWAETLSPTLSSVNIGEEQIAEFAAKMVHNLSCHDKKLKQQIKIRPKLVIRESSVGSCI
jgi:DNA-binding LacI/PurR family transcriptional regulator